jgi:hypothetical protein
VLVTEKSYKRSLVPSKNDPGFIKNLSHQIRLILRLMADRRVNPLVKLLPIGSLVYLIMPDLIPFVLDDALVIGIGSYIFLELCPPEVVAEHRRALWGDESGGEKEENQESVDARFNDR